MVPVRAGRALVFTHELLHEVSRIRSGVRHAIRTDVVYADPSSSMSPEVGLQSHRAVQSIQSQQGRLPDFRYEPFSLRPGVGRPVAPATGTPSGEAGDAWGARWGDDRIDRSPDPSRTLGARHAATRDDDARGGGCR